MATTTAQAREGSYGQMFGVAYWSLNVHGFGSATDFQKTFGNYALAYVPRLLSLFSAQYRSKNRVDILRDFEGLVRCGEMLLVLGRPGSGCSTLLKTLACNTHGIYLSEDSEINYQGEMRFLVAEEPVEDTLLTCLERSLQDIC